MADIEPQISLADEALIVRRGAWRDYAQLAKLRLNLLVLATTLVGYLLAAGDAVDLTLLLALLSGTALAAVGAGALNQYLERDVDRLMERTADRPLPAGRLVAIQVLLLGTILALAGCALLAVVVHPLAALLCAFTVVSYLFLYTPLKSRGFISVLAGAVTGATPPLIGWAAVHGQLSGGAAILFAVMFAWQLPHFMAIAWMYRDDYRRAGLPMVASGDADGSHYAARLLAWTWVLLLVSLLPVAGGLAHGLYLAAAIGLGALFLILALRFCRRRNTNRARHILMASLVYLPALLSAWLLDTKM